MNGPFHDIRLGGGNCSRKVAIGDRNRRAALGGSGGYGGGAAPGDNDGDRGFTRVGRRRSLGASRIEHDGLGGASRHCNDF